MIGTMKAKNNLQGLINNSGSLTGSFALYLIPPSPYSGSYAFTPSEDEQTIRTKNKSLLENITIEPIPSEYIVPSGTYSIIENGEYGISEYASVDVNVPIPSGYIYPSGTYSISANGMYGISEYESVNVDVPVHSLYDSSVTISSAGTVTYTPSAGYDGFSTFTTVTPSGLADALLSLPSISMSLDSSNHTVTVSYHNHDGDHGVLGNVSGFIVAGEDCGNVAVDIDGELVLPSASVDAGIQTSYSTENGVRKWSVLATAYAEESGWANAGELGTSTNTYNAVSSGITISPSTSEQIIGGSNYMMEGSVIVESVQAGYIYPAYVDSFKTISGDFTWVLEYGGMVDTGGYISSATQIHDSVNFWAIPSGTVITPSTSSQTIGGIKCMLEDEITVSPIPSEYIIPSGTKSITTNGTGIDVGSYALVDVSVAGSSVALQTLSVSYTPSTSAISDTLTPSTGYDGFDQVDVDIDAIPVGSLYSTTHIDYFSSGVNRKWRANIGVGIWEGDGYGQEGYIFDETWVSVPLEYNAVPSGTVINPSTTAQTIGGKDYMMESAVTVNAMPVGSVADPPALVDTQTMTLEESTGTVTARYIHTEYISPIQSDGYVTSSAQVGLYMDIQNYLTVPSGAFLPTYGGSFVTQSGNRKFKFTYGTYVDSSGYVKTGEVATDSVYFNAVSSGVTITPSTSTQTIGGNEYMMEGAVTVAPIPSQYIVPSGMMSISENGAYDVASYASVSVSISASYIDGDSLSYGVEPLVGVAIVGQNALCVED